MKAKELETKLPTKLEDLRLKHLPAFTDELFLKRGDDPNPEMVVSFMSKYLGRSEAYLWRMEYHGKEGILAMYLHIVGLFSQFKQGEPLKEITINGKEYEMVQLKRPSVGWLRDVEASDFKKDPTRMVCISYIPKGTFYGDIDEHENLMYPIQSRYDDFKEHFPLAEYFKLNTFFLRRYERSIAYSTLLNQSVKPKRRKKKRHQSKS